MEDCKTVTYDAPKICLFIYFDHIYFLPQLLPDPPPPTSLPTQLHVLSLT